MINFIKFEREKKFCRYMDRISPIVNKMMETDAFSQWLGIKILESEKGSCKLQMEVRPEMCNGFGIIRVQGCRVWTRRASSRARMGTRGTSV